MTAPRQPTWAREAEGGLEPFTRLTAVAAPLDLPDVDTDRIIPARFLRKPRGAPGYASFLFHDVRFDAGGAERLEFEARVREFEERHAREMAWVTPPRR